MGCGPSKTSNVSTEQKPREEKPKEKATTSSDKVSCFNLLTLSTLGKVSVDDILKYFSVSIFGRKQVLTFHANCL